MAELEAAKLAAQGSRPAPLINDPRCPRCSLQPICLPDEINHQRLTELTVNGQPTEEQLTPRKIWPPRDDGIHVVLQREGIRVGVRGQSVRITDKEGEVVRELPLANIESLAVLGGVQISTQALNVFADHEVPVAFLSAAGRLTAMMDPLGPTSAAVRAAQVRVLDRPEKALELARAITVAKIANQRTLLMRNHVNLPSRAASDLQESVAAAEKALTLDELRGHEGNAAAIYFANFAGLFKHGVSEIAAKFVAHGRQRRPPPDPINAVLSFGYSMLANECTAACRLASLEPTLGALHATRPGRPALSLDLMEPFRPIIADSIAVSAFNRGELVEGHFLDTSAGCFHTMERMREQRVKQLASRIAEAALGIGRVKQKHLAAGAKRPNTCVDKPCHAIVIEDLTNYRPEELQTRRENKQLMTWSSAKVKKYLSEACQLHGLHLREVQPGYTSQQDSRTGAPGIRCNDVSVVDFMAKPWWRRQVKLAVEKGEKGDARERFIAAIEDVWTSRSADERKAAKPIRIPANGGELFVSANHRSPAAKGLQADLNAAANIGLKALLDPDWPGKWWFVPCESSTHQPHSDKTKGSLAINAEVPLITAAEVVAAPSASKHGKKRDHLKSNKKQREIVNLWRDASALPVDSNSQWKPTTEYWNYVRARVVTFLRREDGSSESQPVEVADIPW